MGVGAGMSRSRWRVQGPRQCGVQRQQPARECWIEPITENLSEEGEGGWLGPEWEAPFSAETELWGNSSPKSGSEVFEGLPEIRISNELSRSSVVQGEGMLTFLQDGLPPHCGWPTAAAPSGLTLHSAHQLG